MYGVLNIEYTFRIYTLLHITKQYFLNSSKAFNVKKWYQVPIQESSGKWIDLGQIKRKIQKNFLQ